MAAALLQYQACLGIMVRLQVEDLSLLKLDFDRVGRGLSLREFVSVMLERVSWEPESVVSFVEDLVELFAQVDVNGDGTMEWEEFTSAIIEGGMGSSSSGGGDDAIGEWRDLQYEEHPRFVDTAVNRPPKKLEYLPEFRRLLLLESSRPVVELLDPAGLFPPETEENANDGSSAATTDSGEAANSDATAGDEAATSASSFTPTLPVLNKFHPLCYISGYRRDQDEVRSERSPVQALKYLAGVDLLAVSAGDLKLTFWSTTLLTACSTSALDTPCPLAVAHTPRPQRVLEWSPATQHLFSISADLVISVWLVTRDRSQSTGNSSGNAKVRGDSKGDGICEVRLVATLKKHTDLLQDLLMLNADTLLSCGMDGLIHLWDIHTLVPRASRQGHRRGVRLMTKLSSQVFLSAGFECEVFGWEISALSSSPVFRLSGHSAPVCCIQLIPTAAFAAAAAQSKPSKSGPSGARMLADQAITVDDDGWFRWWSLVNVLSMESTDAELSSSRRCLQAFRLGNDLSRYSWRAHSLAVLNHGQSLLVAGMHKLKLLRRVRVKPRVLAASAVLFNEASLTLATATDREVRVWDAASGALLRSYRGLVGADITCVDLDARQRKIVVGAQNGELAVVNYLNGAVLARWTPHGQQVSALLYCKEDRTVLTASWDRSLRLYDDDAPHAGGGAVRNALLRCITDAHESDIKCLAYCHALSLVASGSTDGSIKIWDYIYFLLEDTCVAPAAATASTSSPQSTPPHVQSDVNVLEFIEPYPLLLSGHESGQVCVWSLTPSKPTTLLLCFHPFHMAPLPPVSKAEIPRLVVSSVGDPEAVARPEDADAPESDLEASPAADVPSVTAFAPLAPPASPPTPAKRNSAVTCCRSFYDETGGDQLAVGIDRGRFLLFSASFYGEVVVCDISRVISGAHVRAFREENMPSRQDRAYNPRRRFLRQGKNTKRLRNKYVDNAAASDDHHALNQPVQVKESDVLCTHRWTAHRGNVRCLQIVAEPRGVLTCGSDKGVKVWDFQGRCLGNLAPGASPVAPPPQQQSSPVKGEAEVPPASVGSSADTGRWKWEVDVATAAIAKREQAQSLWDELSSSKTKLMSSGQTANRLRQRSVHAIPLRSSASTPILGSRSSLSAQSSVDPAMVSSSSTSALDATSGPATQPSGEQPSKETAVFLDHTQRLLQQLQGTTTWKQSDLQLARQAAWEKERVKFQQRVKQLVKQKAKEQKLEQAAATMDPAEGNQQGEGTASGALDGGVSDSLGKLATPGAGGDAVDSSLLLPTLQNPVQDLPFADKDNWAVGSLNRERQMYEHFHHENVRRSSKQIAGSSGLLRQRRLEKSLAGMDLTPSVFLLEKLGVSCIIRENQEHSGPPARQKTGKKVRPKRIAALGKTQSMTALPSFTGPLNASSNQSEPALAVSSSTSALPRRTLLATLCQQYDELLGKDEADSEKHTARLLTRAASFAPRSRHGDSTDALAVGVTASPNGIDPSSEQEQSTAATSVSTVKLQAKGLEPQPARRRHPKSALTTADRGSKTRKGTPSSSSAGTVRTANTTEKEKTSAKKVRIRSDAALMRQERFGPYTREDVLNIYRTFRKLDQDHSGCITMREILSGAGLFGPHLQDDMDSIFSSIDQDHSGQIDLAELCGVVFGDATPAVLEEILRLCRLLETVEKTRRVHKKTLSAEQVAELRQLFKLYDKDDNGDIDASELFEALKYNDRFYESDRRDSVRLTKDDMVRLISRFDVNANATLDLDEFIELFRDDA
ncbi:hypothetical protein BBJ28_00015347 [Nothophytophthora sp. Chile5]|nr:hypothetical protein BBJ28_00015347 [Nothophytophthora sp. Chile5]